ncbi:MAG: hypothetical protein DRR08_26680 [Candidatus Parabeggiatoa sp. nov. 2]|nr:MAG: hypothetical protein B6247_25915 [Beggiatoa sp. 4572_84]RKZ54212.1 MAG: hypothetical protein DRR08_26680 [Gammaproteobacteria bacterium]
MSPRWIFIIGCYNSGTTLLEQIIHQHPSIAGLPNEGQFLTDALITPKTVGVPRLWAEKQNLFRFAPDEKSDEANKIKQDWTRLLDKPQAPFAVEKSPTNTARTLWLQHHFEQPYFIHIVRNGYAVALGIHDKILAVYGEMPQLLQKAANQWARSIEIVLEDAPALSHFLEIRYEDFTANPKNVTTQILKFLGLPPISSEITEQKYTIHGLHSPITNKNASRLAQMTAEQQKIIYARAGKLLNAYGY